jgi:hypothetical protein
LRLLTLLVVHNVRVLICRDSRRAVPQLLLNHHNVGAVADLPCFGFAASIDIPTRNNRPSTSDGMWSGALIISSYPSRVLNGSSNFEIAFAVMLRAVIG